MEGRQHDHTQLAPGRHFNHVFLGGVVERSRNDFFADLVKVYPLQIDHPHATAELSVVVEHPVLSSNSI